MNIYVCKHIIKDLQIGARSYFPGSSTLIFLFVFLCLISIKVKGNTVDVYVYNTEFSINPPGQPIESAIILQGDSIRWVWVQGGHTTTSVTGSPEQWNVEINSSLNEYTRQFNNIGVFTYYCIPHGTDNGDGTAIGMSGTITVLAAGSGACCLPDGSCTTTTSDVCLAQDGYFLGTGSLCDTATCYASLAILPNKDNTMFEDATGELSLALGENFYVGKSNQGLRRSLISFNLDEIPEFAVIDSVKLRLYCTDNPNNPATVGLYRSQTKWGEGTSYTGGNQSNGAQATSGDATWIHPYYDTTLWDIAGGDFLNIPTAETEITAKNTFYDWKSPTLTEDIIGWIDTPSVNTGWILIGDEINSNSIARFTSKEGLLQDERPSLIVSYAVPPTGACCLDDGSCLPASESHCIALGGTYNGDGTTCSVNSCEVQLTHFIDPLPIPVAAIPKSGEIGGKATYRIEANELFQQLHSELPPTRVWGYDGSYPGPTIEAFKDSLITVRWINNIRVIETSELRASHVLTVDTCLHGPNMTGTVPVTVTHLHGGKVAPESDGYPEDAFVPGDSSDLYYYPNIQPAGILWYHDHALGITRLNVMMGLAGFYMLRDSVELSLNLPSGEFEIPLAIQDKTLNVDGTMYYPEHHADHFFGNHILVNGKVWPYLNVKKGKYRFRLLNGSNSRAYTLYLSDLSPITQIGTELGLLTTPVLHDSITMLPGERMDIVIDFEDYTPGTEVYLMNNAPAPFPGSPGVGVIPDIMKFIVQDSPGFTSALPDSLFTVDSFNIAAADEERLFELYTAPGPDCEGSGNIMWTINGIGWDSITEFPVQNSTEIWTWHNESGISHPMHMHLVRFQVVDRQAIDASTGLPTGPLLPPESHERGWKDTANSPPGFRTRTIARFTGFTGKFSYHCHILEHEDHEMMRQFEVLPCRLVTSANDNGPGSLRFAIDCAMPGDTVFFSDEILGDTINLLDTISISKDINLLNNSGTKITINATGISHCFTVQSGAQVYFRNLDLIPGSGTTGKALINYGTSVLEDMTIGAIDSLAPNSVYILNQGNLLIKQSVYIFK